MTFIHQLLHTALPLWNACAETPFLQNLASGRLPETHFAHYMLQDALYLHHYTHLCQVATQRATDTTERQLFQALLTAVTSDEAPLRYAVLARYGLDETTVLHTSPCAVTQEYINLLTHCAESNNNTHLLMVLLPCMLSYSHAFRRLVQEQQPLHPRYRTFILDYADPAFATDCTRWLYHAATHCSVLPTPQRRTLAQHFLQASTLELRFWFMANQPLCINRDL